MEAFEHSFLVVLLFFFNSPKLKELCLTILVSFQSPKKCLRITELNSKTNGLVLLLEAILRH